jgi:hypothetical protein
MYYYTNYGYSFIKLYYITILVYSLVFILLNLWLLYLNFNFDITNLYTGNSNIESHLQPSNSINESVLHHTESFIEKYFGMLCF